MYRLWLELSLMGMFMSLSSAQAAFTLYGREPVSCDYTYFLASKFRPKQMSARRFM